MVFSKKTTGWVREHLEIPQKNERPEEKSKLQLMYYRMSLSWCLVVF